MFKNITYQTISQHVEHLEFQHIVSDEAVNSIIKLVLANRDKNQNLIQQFVEEIPYNALPKDFVQEVVIDLDGLKAGTTIKVGDLDISKNENIKIAVPEDTLVLTVTEKKTLGATDETDAKEQSSEN